MHLTNKSVHYNDFHKKGCDYLNSIGYIGKVYRTSYFWKDILELDTKQQVKYLEIGAFHGANALSFLNIYGEHDLSEVHCIDPWLSYGDYNEYSEEQNTNYHMFMNNVNRISAKSLSKLYIHRGFSHDKLKHFAENYFNVIYIDGNHNPEYVLEDAVMSFRKLKENGYMIFDDYGWKNVHEGVDAFLNVYKEYIKIIACQNSQVIIQKVC